MNRYRHLEAVRVKMCGADEAPVVDGILVEVGDLEVELINPGLATLWVRRNPEIAMSLSFQNLVSPSTRWQQASNWV